MTPSTESRKYEIVLLGATGYTGTLTAQFIAKHFPADLKWAVAGRSKAKLYELLANLRTIRPDRSPPEIEIVDLEQADQISSVVQQTKVCISVVTYKTVGEVVVQACIEHLTDYVDTMGDVTFTQQWIAKYHETAVSRGVALIHASGMFSGPQDLLTWATARELRRSFAANTKEVILANKKIDENPSGGTFDSLKSGSSAKKDPNIAEQYLNPWALSPIPGVSAHIRTGSFGIRDNADLGLLSIFTFSGAQNQAFVYRTWGLLQDTQDAYGPNFQYNEYQSVNSTFGGLLNMIKLKMMKTLLSFSIALRLMSLFMPAPGSGPDVRKTEKIPIKIEALAVADGSQQRTYGSFSFPSGAYHTTALFLSQAAASLLYSRSLEGNLKGGCLTPSMLGEDLLERLKAAGATIEISPRE